MSHYNRSHMARRYPHHSYHHSNYSHSASSYDKNIDYDKILWNTSSPSKLIESIPNILSYSSNYDNGFNKHLNCIKKLITWLENESDIFDKSLLNESKFVKIKNEMENVTNCISNGLDDCHNLIEKNQISYSNYSKFKARLANIKNEYNSIQKRMNQSMYKLSRQFKQKHAKKSLLSNANKSSYAQADEYQHLKSSMSIIDDTLQMINDVTHEMKNQSNFLKQTKGKLLKFINLTGFATSIIRVISQRSKMDFYIFIVGCITTLLIIFLLWYYF